MRHVVPRSRQKLSAKSAVLHVDRDLANPFTIGEIVRDATDRFEVVAVEGTSDPKQISLVVHKLT